MTGRSGRSNAMLAELIIVLLFFSLSASVTLRLFVSAHEKSAQSRLDTAAMNLLEDTAERFAASNLSSAAFLDMEGWTALADGRGRACYADANGARTDGADAAITLVALPSVQTRATGTLYRLELAAYEGGDADGDAREIARLPAARYDRKEAAP